MRFDRHAILRCAQRASAHRCPRFVTAARSSRTQRLRAHAHDLRCARARKWHGMSALCVKLTTTRARVCVCKHPPASVCRCSVSPPQVLTVLTVFGTHRERISEHLNKLSANASKKKLHHLFGANPLGSRVPKGVWGPRTRCRDLVSVGQSKRGSTFFKAVVGQMQSDGEKKICGFGSLRAPCTILSVGCNNKWDFEVAIAAHRATCTLSTAPLPTQQNLRRPFVTA